MTRPRRRTATTRPASVAALHGCLWLSLAGSANLWAQTPLQYQDRVMDEVQLNAQLAEEDDSIFYNTQGLPRYLRMEARLSSQPLGPTPNSRASGLILNGLIETPLYGVLSVDTALQPATGSVARQQQWTVRQRDVPMPDGWRVNNELGIVATPAPDIMRQLSRVYVPLGLLAGASTEWRRDQLQISVSAGQPGRLEGAPVSGFHPMEGRNWNLGLQASAGDWVWAARHTEARGITPFDQSELAAKGVDANATQMTLRKSLAYGSLQLSSVTSTDNRFDGQQQGHWLDLDWREGAYQHSTGLYWLAPNLAWAGAPLASDTTGAYARTQWDSRRWSADGGVDALRSVSQPANTGYFALGHLRWRYSRDTSFGLGGSLRHFQGDGWTQFTDVRWSNDWGQSNVRLDLAQGLDAFQSRLVTLDHSWRLLSDWQLSTGVSTGQRSSNTTESTGLWAASLSMSGALSANSMARLQLGADQLQTGDAHQSVTAGLQWRINPRWSLDCNLYFSRGVTYLPPNLDPLATPALADSTTSSRAFYMVLRYENSAGSRDIPLGGRVRDGAGRIEGTVYMDSNSDGVQQAGETGITGAVVYLDGRYPVRTSVNGHFEFPFVVSGVHTLSVQNESLPLPWVSPEASRSITLEVRDSMQISMPVVRPGQ